jgi:hypothetical protein
MPRLRQARGDLPQGQAAPAEEARHPHGLRLAGFGHQRAAVVPQPRAERNPAHALAPGLLHRQRRPGARSDGRPLELAEDVQHLSHHPGSGIVPLRRAIRGDDASATGHGGRLDGPGHEDVAREAVALGGDQYAGPLRGEVVERGQKPRALVEPGPA